jgi:hypothetical protein
MKIMEGRLLLQSYDVNIIDRTVEDPTSESMNPEWISIPWLGETVSI